MKLNVKSRYPGLVPFCEQQKELFCGREIEISQLYNLILSEQIVILFAKSGIGKSSLLNAGLFPELKSSGFYPIRVRFQNPASEIEVNTNLETESSLINTETSFQSEIKSLSPKAILERALEQQDEDFSINCNRDTIIKTDKDKINLWELIKVLNINQKKKESSQINRELSDGDKDTCNLELSKTTEAKDLNTFITPVLIFDQFEEFFRYPDAQREEFLEELSEVLHSLAPKRIAEWLRSIDSQQRTPQMLEWIKQPHIKCVIAIREDKLAEIDQLRKFIPLILKNRYRLNPLKVKNAKEAMEKPASIEGNFTALPFKYDEVLLNEILSKLSESDIVVPEFSYLISNEKMETNNISEFLNGHIDASQLQKVCMHIEKKVIIAQQQLLDQKDMLTVSEKLINPQIEIQTILDNFYGEQLKTIGSESEIKLCRTIIEDHMVSAGSRTSLTEGQFYTLLKSSSKIKAEKLINKLIEARLIKEEYTHLGRTFELSHDTLVKPVTKYAEQNKLQRANKIKFIYGFLLIISSILLIACGFFFYKMTKASNAVNISFAENYYQQGNHFMAFNIWDNYYKRSFFAGNDKSNIFSKIDTTAFFDIGAGESTLFLSDRMIAVHEYDNSISLWQIDYKNGLPVLDFKKFRGAKNMMCDDSRHYLGYRRENGELMIYDVAKKQEFPVVPAKTELSRKNDDDQKLDLKMNFVHGDSLGSYFVGYFNKFGNVNLYNLNKRSSVRLNILKLKYKGFNSDFIRNEMRVSSDGRYLAIHKLDSLKIIDIFIPTTKKIRTIRGVKGICSSFESNLLCYYTADSLIVENYGAEPDKNIGFRSFLYGTPKLSPDGSHLFFYNEKRELVVINGVTNKIETIIRDMYFNLPYLLLNGDNVNTKWASDRGMIKYLDKKYFQNYYRVKGMTKTEEIIDKFRPATNFEIEWTISENTIKGTRNGIEVYREGLLTQGISYPMSESAFGEALLSRNRGYLAYITRDSQGIHKLKVIDAKSLKVVLVQAGIKEINNVFNENYIMVKDKNDHSGIYFFKTGKRDYHYYDKLYPDLSSEEKKLLGISIF